MKVMATAFVAPEVRPRGSSFDEMEELLGEIDVLGHLPRGDLAEDLYNMYSDPPALLGAAPQCAQLAPKTQAEHGFAEGDRVQTQWSVEEGGNDEWFPATVAKVQKDGKCELNYDDGSSWLGDARYIVRLTLPSEPVPAPPRDWKRKQPAESPTSTDPFTSHAFKLPRTLATPARPAEEDVDAEGSYMYPLDAAELHVTGVQQVLDPDEQALLSELSGVFGTTNTKETLRMALDMMRKQRDGGVAGATAVPSLCKFSSAAVLCRCPVPMSEEPKFCTPPESLSGTPPTESGMSSPTSPADIPVPAAAAAGGANVDDFNRFRQERSTALSRVGPKALEYSRFMDCHGFGVALMDMQGNFLCTNTAIQGLLGYSGEQMELLSMMHMTPAEDLPGMMAMIPRLMEPGCQPTTASPMVSKPITQP